MTDFFSKYSKVDTNKLQSTIDRGVVEQGTGRVVVTKEELNKAISQNKEKEVVAKKVEEINRSVRSSRSRTSNKSSNNSVLPTREQYMQENPLVVTGGGQAPSRTKIITRDFVSGIKENININSDLNVAPIRTGGVTSASYRTGARVGKVIEVTGKAVTTGVLLSGLFNLGIAATSAVKSTQLGKAVTVGVTKAQSTAVGSFGVKTIGATGRAVGIVKGTELISDVTAPQDQKKLAKKYDIEKAVSAGFQAERDSFSIPQGASIGEKALGVLSIAGYETTSLIRGKNTKTAFEDTVKKELQSQGLEGNDLYQATEFAKRKRTASGVGELGALLDISRSSELLGRDMVSKVFAKSSTTKAASTGLKVGTRAALGIAPAGFLEGSVQELTQQISRRQDLNVKSIATMGGLGAGFAGVIGGTIAGTSASKSKGVQKIGKGLQLGAYLTDPLEKPGDILADITQKSIVRSGRSVINPSVSVNTFTNVLSFGTTETKPKVKGGQVNLFTDVLSLSNTNTNTNTDTKRRGGQVNLFTDVLSFTNTNVPVNTNINTNINTKSNTNINVKENGYVPVNPFTNINIPVQENIQSPIDTFTNINVPVNTNINTPINTFIPNKFVPPILPFELGGLGGSGKGTKKGKKKVYVNELEASRKILKNMLGGGFF